MQVSPPASSQDFLMDEIPPLDVQKTEVKEVTGSNSEHSNLITQVSRYETFQDKSGAKREEDNNKSWGSFWSDGLLKCIPAFPWSMSSEPQRSSGENRTLLDFKSINDTDNTENQNSYFSACLNNTFAIKNYLMGSQQPTTEK